ncbi:MAG: peptidoglycan-binding protein, partial [Oscillospiraceae bacterium]|nr:peptidoglycan-binding protein [Oscillospiraceae bacterium]
VKALQQLLNRLGYGLAEDGIIGSGTERAVRSFQQKYGLTVDGYVGPASWKKLGEVANPKADTGSNAGSGNSGTNTGTSGGNAGTGSNTGSGTTTKPVGTTISVTGRSMVYYGCSGSDVKALQQLLNILGYGLSTDGIFGNGTNSAVRSFQSKQKLVVDGYVGSATWAALGKACGSGSVSGNTTGNTTGSTTGNTGSTGNSNSSNNTNSSNGTNISTSGRPTVGYGDSGSNVKALQQLLNKYGYGLVEDGIFGSGTYSAVKNFQASKGLAADGIVGPLTWAKL